MKAIKKVVPDLPDEEQETSLPCLRKDAKGDVREMTGFNARGLWTLARKETQRFLNIWIQTILSPLVMTLLFYAVFSLAVPGASRMVGAVPFLKFLIPGLVMMSIAQSSFMSPAAALVLSKLQGNIVDVLMAPLSPFEMMMGYVVSGLVRGLIVGTVSLGAMLLFVSMPAPHLWAVLYFACMGSLAMSLLGVVTGVWSDDFDHMVAVQNFVIMPATFLSGTFFSVNSLPLSWRWTCHYNPFFYMIDGFRYGLTGHAEGNIWGGMAILLFVTLALSHVAYWMFARGTKLKT